MASKKRKSIWRDLGAFAIVALITLSARSSLADHYRIPTGSMEPTVHAGDRVIVLKTAYDLRLPFTNSIIATTGEPARGDVVVLDSPDQDMLLLKRIVALPGDQVAVQNGLVWIDGEQSVARHVTQGMGPDLAELTLEPDQYLVLGDNRGNSRDGRIFGTIARKAIRGQAIGVYRSQQAFTWREL